MPNFSHGKKSHVEIEWDQLTQVGTNISTYLDKVDFPRSSKDAETSAFGNEDETFIAGLRGAELSFEGMFDPTMDALITDIFESSARTTNFAYGPAGKTTGLIYYTGLCLITDYNVSGAVADKVKATLKFKVTGPVARYTFA
jgi:hypothetical protein